MKIEVEISNEDLKEAVIQKIVYNELGDAVHEELRNNALRQLVKEIVRERIDEALRQLDLPNLQRIAVEAIETQMKAAIRKAMAAPASQVEQE